MAAASQLWALTLPSHNRVRILQWNCIKQTFNSTEFNHVCTKQKEKSYLPITSQLDCGFRGHRGGKKKEEEESQPSGQQKKYSFLCKGYLGGNYDCIISQFLLHSLDLELKASVKCDKSHLFNEQP